MLARRAPNGSLRCGEAARQPESPGLPADVGVRGHLDHGRHRSELRFEVFNQQYERGAVIQSPQNQVTFSRLARFCAAALTRSSDVANTYFNLMRKWILEMGVFDSNRQPDETYTAGIMDSSSTEFYGLPQVHSIFFIGPFTADV